MLTPMPRCADAARTEAYKKGVFNQLLTHLSVYYAKEAVCGSAVNAATWSKAAAIYGNSIAEHVDNYGSTPAATANKRCKNYDTCVTNAVNQDATDGVLPALNYQAATNVAIMNAFLEATAANVEIVMEQIKVTYIQAALRYLNKLDKNLIADPVQPVSTLRPSAGASGCAAFSHQSLCCCRFSRTRARAGPLRS